VSLGKSRITLLDEALSDYLASLRVLYPYADYLAINVSSPNTPGLRSLQDRGHLNELLGALRREAVDLAGTPPDPLGLSNEPGRAAEPKPLLVKIAPDLSEAEIADVLAVCLDHGVAGIIATNTTVSRTGLVPGDIVLGGQEGGLSGRPLGRRAAEVVGFVHREVGSRLPIIGVGGILEPDDALRLVDAGASLVQLYTGLIYRGPGLIRSTARALAQHERR
jgi:dihydroorotate dehydrogenase